MTSVSKRKTYKKRGGTTEKTKPIKTFKRTSTSVLKSSRRTSVLKNIPIDKQEDYNAIFRRFIGNPNVRGKLLEENQNGEYIIGPTLFYTDSRETMTELKSFTQITPEQPNDTIFENGFLELHFAPQLFRKSFSKFILKPAKGTIVIREKKEGEVSLPVHFCGYVYKDRTLYIFDPSYSSHDVGTYFTDAFYDHLNNKKIKWEHVMIDRAHAWQDENLLLKKDYFCQTWSLKWLLNPTMSENEDFTLPGNATETSNLISKYFHEIIELIDKDGKRQEFIDLFPQNRWEGHNPNDVLNYIRTQITPSVILKIYN